MAATTRKLGGFSFRMDIDPAKTITGAQRAANAAAQLVGEYIKQRSNAIVPLRQGILKASSRVTPKGDGKVEVSYNKVYASYQHEGVSFNHPNGRQAKYLESVMKDPATAERAREIFGQELKKHL